MKANSETEAPYFLYCWALVAPTPHLCDENVPTNRNGTADKQCYRISQLLSWKLKKCSAALLQRRTLTASCRCAAAAESEQRRQHPSRTLSASTTSESVAGFRSLAGSMPSTCPTVTTALSFALRRLCSNSTGTTAPRTIASRDSQ
jgi:hypothetical protein